MRHHLSLLLLACLLLASGGINPSVGAVAPPTPAETPAVLPASAPAVTLSDLPAQQPEPALVPSLSATPAEALAENDPLAELNSLLTDETDVFSATGTISASLGADVSPAGDVNGDGYADIIVGAPGIDAAYVYYGTTNGLTTVGRTTLTGADASRFGSAVSTAGDVNGDGYADVIVGAPDTNGSGAASLYLGTEDGLNPIAALTIEGTTGDLLGAAVGTAGDLNNDGFTDVLIGAPGAGEVRIVFGQNPFTGATTETITDSSVAGFGASVDTAGDVNADGYADMLVGVPSDATFFLYTGTTSGISTTAVFSDTGAASFGTIVSTAGDVNGDGYADVLVSEPDNTSAYIYFGSNNTAVLTRTTAILPTGGSGVVGPAGDTDGDGYADMLVQSADNEVKLYRGGSGDVSTFEPTERETLTGLGSFGAALDTAGDVNGDGYADILIGAPTTNTNRGSFFVYPGAPGSLLDNTDYEIIDINLDPDIDVDRFGQHTTMAGDLNGDGYGDIVANSVAEDRAYVYYGSPSGITNTPDRTLDNPSNNNIEETFGSAVAAAGDVDGDGYEDLLVSDRGYGADDRGRVYLYCGQEGTINSVPNWSLEGESATAHFGWGISSAGDVNGDGYADIIIGAPLQDIEGAQNTLNNGKVFVYYGRADFCANAPTSADWELVSVNRVTDLLGQDVSTAGDVNGDGYSDVIIGAPEASLNGAANAGVALVYHGSPNGLPTTAPLIDNPDWSFEGQEDDTVGYLVNTAGDVNGDGYSDVLVSATRDSVTGNSQRRVYLFFGSASGLTQPDTPGADNSNAQAVLVAAYRNDGTEPQYEIANTAGDVNGDGLSDILVAKYEFLVPEGGGTVYLGSATNSTGLMNEGPLTEPDFTDVTHTPVVTLTAQSRDGLDIARMAYSVNPAGDVNGDGFADVLVTVGDFQTGAFLYYGNDGQGRHMLPRQLRTGSDTQISYLGNSDSLSSARLSLLGYTPLGGIVPVTLEWQAAPLGTSLDSADVLTGTTEITLTQGLPITATISNMEISTPYHWRVRLRYPDGNRLGQSVSRWYQTPRNAQTEQDFSTKGGLILATSPANPVIVGTQSELTAVLNVRDAVPLEHVWTRDISDPSRLPGTNTLTTLGTDNDTRYTYPSVGTYEAQVVVTYQINGTGPTLTLTDTAIINIVPDIENLDFSLATDSPTIVGDTTTLTATLVGATPRSYLWQFGDGEENNTTRDPAPNPDVITHIYQNVGTYTATVDILYEGGGDTPVRAEAPVQIVDEPLAGLTATYTQTSNFAGEPVQFGASITQGTNPVYTWDFGNNTTRQSQTTSYTYLDPGTYNVTVTVRNSENVLTTTVGPITVVDQPIAGTLTAENDSPTFFGDTTTLTATVPEGTNIYYIWDFGDGEQAVTQNRRIRHVYPSVGAFEATVTVSNSVTAESETTAATTSVSIEDRTITGLVAMNDSPTLLGDTTTFTASVATGTNVEYQWDFTDGTTTEWSTDPVTTHTFLQQGTYVVRVRAQNSATSEVALATTDAVILGPELSISKVASLDEVKPEEPITFTLTIENSGSYTATNLIITDQLPDGATFVEAPFVDGSDNGQLTNNEVIWNVDELAPGASVSVLLIVTAETAITNDTYSVRTEDQFGLNVAGDSGISVSIDTPNRIYLPILSKANTELPDLVGTFSISPNKTTFSADEQVTISGQVTNQGNVASTESFWVDLFINPTTPPSPDDLPTIWNLRCEQPCIGISWAVTQTLQPGESFTFNSTADSYRDEYTIWEGYFDANPTSLYLYVDPWAAEGAPHREQGVVVELLEDNNLTKMENLTVQGIVRNQTSAPARWLPPRPDLNAQS